MLLSKKWIFSLLTIIEMSSPSINAEIITLESNVISHIDGIFIKADQIEFMHKARKALISLLQKYNLKELAQQEINNKSAATLSAGVDHAVKEMNILTKSFISIAQGVKPLITGLIEECCKRRSRSDSLLLNWAHTPEGQEEQTFKKDMTGALALYTFGVDLANFLNDLIHSCPKACTLFNERREKEELIYKLLPTLISRTSLPNTKETYVAVFKYIKKHHIDHLQVDTVTEHKLEELLAAFIAKSAVH